MELNKMDQSINDMEEIVSRMKTIKDAYALLEKNSQQYQEGFNHFDNLRKEFKTQSSNNFENYQKLVKTFEGYVKEISLLEEKIQKSYREIFDLNEGISKDVNAKFRDVKIEMCDLKNDMKELIKETSEYIKKENREIKETLVKQSKKSNLFLILLIASILLSVVLFIIFCK